MADEKAPGGAATAPAKEGEAGEKKPEKKGINKKFIIIGVILVVDLAVMAGLGFFIVGKLKGKTEDPVAAAAREEDELEKQKQEQLTKIGKMLPKALPFTVNIGSSTESHYLKCAVQLEWESAGGEEGGGGGKEGEGGPTDPMLEEITKRQAKINDIIINILSAQSYSDLLKPSGKQKIKEAIVTEINTILPTPDESQKEKGKAQGTGKLRNSFFTEFLVQ